MDTTPHSLSEGRRPDFLVIGAMKSGTTTLHALLAQHPRIFMCEPKEPGFFSRDDRYEDGISSYFQLFSGALPDQLCGESSTCYSRHPTHPHAASRIAEHLPDVRLIYLMRHPVERAYSHYLHRMTERFHRGDGPVLLFEDAVVDIPEIREASLYAMQLEQFRRHFPRDRFLLLTTDELHQDPGATAQKVHAFLEIPPLQPRFLSEENSKEKMFRAEAANGVFRRIRYSKSGRLITSLLPDSFKGVARPRLKRLLRASISTRREAQFREQVSPLGPELRAALLRDFEKTCKDLAQSWEFSVPMSWHE